MMANLIAGILIGSCIGYTIGWMRCLWGIRKGFPEEYESIRE